jgi:probable HAF family extracellular repeat protein
LLARTAAAQTYTFKVIDDNNAAPQFNGGNPYTEVFVINDAGTVVGVYSSADYVSHGFIGSGAAPNDIVFPGACLSSCGTVGDGINDLGEIVGEWDDGDGYTHAFYLNPPYGNIPIVFDYPNAYLTIAEGVNKLGVIVGIYQDSTGTHGFKGTPGQLSPVNIPNCTNTWLWGINDSGTVVGTCQPSANSYSYNPNSGPPVSISVPGSTTNGALYPNPNEFACTCCSWLWEYGGSLAVIAATGRS